jgi:hypothetical protein
MGDLYLGSGIEPAYVLTAKRRTGVIDYGDRHLAHNVGGIHIVIEESVTEDSTHKDEQHRIATTDGPEFTPGYMLQQGMSTPAYHTDERL